MIRFVFVVAITLTATIAPTQQPTMLATANGHIPGARDAGYPGTMMLHVDATDITRAIFSVKQTMPVQAPGPMTLLFPKWLPGNHAPRGQIEKLAGLVIKAGGQTLVWKRDPVDVYAFHIIVPSGAKQIDIAFQFLSATDEDQGRIVATDAMLNLQWQSVSLYPAGYATRRIPVLASVTYPKGWQAGTALRTASANGDTVTYRTVDYETLVDSPVFAGKFFRTEPLGQNVTLNIIADEAKYLAATPEQIAVHRKLVDQAVKLFGTRQFDHYDFLLALTDIWVLSGLNITDHRKMAQIQAISPIGTPDRAAATFSPMN